MEPSGSAGERASDAVEVGARVGVTTLAEAGIVAEDTGLEAIVEDDDSQPVNALSATDISGKAPGCVAFNFPPLECR